MKQFVLIILIVLIAAILAGCCAGATAVNSDRLQNQAATATSVKVLKYWIWEEIEGAHQFEADLWNSTHESIKVRLEAISSSNYHDKLLTAISAGNAPDVMLLITAWSSEFVGMNALEPLDRYIMNWPEKADVYPVMLDLCKLNGKYYGFPETNATYYIYCNKQLFQKANVEFPQTIDQFYEACRKLTRKTSDGQQIFAWAMRGARNGHFMWSSIIMADAESDYMDVRGRISMNTSAMVAANQRYLDIYKNGWAPTTAPIDGMTQTLEAFKAGQVAMCAHQICSGNEIVNAMGENLVIIPMPASRKGYHYSALEPQIISIASTSQYKDEAAEFCKFVTSDQIQDILCQTVGQIPITRTLASQPFYQTDMLQTVSLAQLPDGKPQPNVPQFAYFQEKLWPQTMQQALLGEISSQEMMDILNEGLK